MGFGFGSENLGLVDQVQGKTISEAADLLLGQLQQLKAEEKELKRKRKEEKALMKMKVASQVQSSTRKCEMSSSASSESSESSDDECQNLVDMKSLKIGTLAQTIPEACDRALENAIISPGISTIVEPLTLYPEADTSVEISSTSSTSTEEPTGRTTSLEVLVPEQKGECRLEASDCHIGNVGSSITLGSRSSAASIAAATTTAAAEGTKRIEVCMGGKCKRLGAGALLEEFQRVAGIEAAVSGCKCMGKCKVGPNVRISGCSSSSDAFQAGDLVALSSAATTTTSNSLCIGVGLEDVSLIAANLLGRYQEAGLANALP